MVNRSDIETFWTRGDIHSRVHKAMSEAGLNDRKSEIEDLFPIDQYLSLIHISEPTRPY